MESYYNPPRLFFEERTFSYRSFHNSEDFFDICQEQDKILFFSDFDQAYEKIFSKEKKEDIGVEDDVDDPNLFKGRKINKMEINDVIQENPIIIRDPSVKKVEKKEEKDLIFTKGFGIVNAFKKQGINVNFNSKKVILSEYKEKIFSTKEMVKENGKIKAKKKRRKFKPDNIRKKIKARFHKDLKNILNEKLKKVHSEKFFELLPQSFITNITIKLNKQILESSFENLVLHDCLEDTIGKEKNPDRDKYNKNLEVMKYLDENKEISEKFYFEKIKKMKYEELLRAYFSSVEFENSLIELYNKNKSEKIDYIEEYVNKALTYIDFFKNPPNKIWGKSGKIEEKDGESNTDSYSE